MHSHITSVFNISAIALCLLVVPAFFVFAQDTGEEASSATSTATSTTATTTDVSTAEPSDAPQARTLSPETKIRVTNLAANMSNRIEAAVERMEKITARLESRTEKLEQAGYVTDDVRFYINESKTALIIARGTIAGVDERVEQMVHSENPQAQWLIVREDFNGSKMHLLRTHQFLRATIAAMKAVPLASVPTEESATTTDEETQ